MKFELLVIGDCSIDQYMEVDSPQLFHDPHTKEATLCFLHGSKIPVSSFHYAFAGNAAHVGVGTQKLGIQTAIYTELGNDDYAKQFVARFEKEGLDTTFCKKNEDTSTNVHAIILYKAERTIFSYHEPRKYALPFEKMQKPTWIYYTSLAKGFENFQNDLVDYLDKNRDVVLAFNPGSIQLKDGSKKLTNILEKTHILFANKQEACTLLDLGKWTDKKTKDLHEMLHEIGPKLSVITDGQNGSSAYDGKKFIEMGPPEVKGKVVDKTGAGDSYAAAFIAALNNKKTLREAMEWGNRNAASVVTCFGCLDGLLSKEEMH